MRLRIFRGSPGNAVQRESFMRRYAQRSLRPLIYISVAVLILSLLAPWMWRAEQVARSPIVSSTNTQSHDLESAHAVNDGQPSENCYPDPGPLENSRDEPLAEFNILPQLADAFPPVAERIALDPSLAEPPDRRPATPSHPRPQGDTPDDLPSPDDLETPLPKPVERTPPILPPHAAGVWPHAAELEKELAVLVKESPDDEPWISRVQSQLDALVATDSLASRDAQTVLGNLRQLAMEVKQAPAPHEPTRAGTLRQRAAHAILRRLAIWDLVAQLAADDVAPRLTPTFSPAELAFALDEIDDLLTDVKAGASWKEYLRLENLRQLTRATTPPDAEARLLARDVLGRLDSPRLDKQQHQFVSGPAFCRLAEALQPAAPDPVDWGGLLSALEERELHDSSVVSRRIAEMCQVMRWSDEEAIARLATAVNDNHRNANVRIALSAQLLNRFVPPPQIMAEGVVDNVRGADVVGRSESVARLRIVLVPDRLRWRLGLEAHGNIASETESSKGPARFWNDGRGQFNARKEVTLDRRGLAVAKAEAQADAEAFLKDFETDYDSIPLLSFLVRSIARNQYEKEQPAARTEIGHKISQRASQKLDQEVDQKMVQAEREFKQKLIAPLDRLNLEPTAVDMQTTEERLIARYRLAGSHQLSAHTPRPQAPGNSMVSLQLHETMLNNTLENLKLDDRRVDLRTLYVEMLRRFEAKVINIPEDLPEDVTVHFAEHDPVRITCEEGRVKLTIRLKELDHAGENIWKNFEVRGYYRPSDNQLEANLVRDGNLELAGERLKLGDQIALRGIFAKVLSRNRQLSIINKQLLMRPQLADLQVTQFVIQDGWIGVALGPKSDNMRPTPAPIVDEAEMARRPLRHLFHNIR